MGRLLRLCGSVCKRSLHRGNISNLDYSLRNLQKDEREEETPWAKKKFHEELLAVLKSISLQSQEIEYRPCYVNGRKALFHRWVNTANPTAPKGVDPSDERVRFFQHRSTTGLVEYEDGTVSRVWPQEIRFADSDKRFKEHEWSSAEKTEGR